MVGLIFKPGQFFIKEIIMKQSITINLEEALIRKIQNIAAEKRTSVSRVVSIGLSEIDDDLNDYKAAKKQAIAYLKKGFHIGGRRVHSREELHER
jgi:hypothetical protein